MSKFAAILVTATETAGGILLLLGLLTPVAACGVIAAMIDAEHAFDPSWGKKLGVDLEMLLVSQPSSGEEAMQITEMLVKSNAVMVVVFVPGTYTLLNYGSQTSAATASASPRRPTVRR